MSNLIKFGRYLQDIRLSNAASIASVPASEPAPDREAIYAEAFAAGQTAARAEYEEAMQDITALQTQTLERLQATDQQLTSEVEAALPELILEGVRRIIGEWEPNGQQVETLVRDMLAGLEGDAGQLRVWLCQKDKEHMLSLHEDLERDFPGVSILEDPSLRSGECIARSRFGTTDGRFEARLASLRKVFK